jgi:hypothetical protein
MFLDIYGVKIALIRPVIIKKSEILTSIYFSVSSSH